MSPQVVAYKIQETDSRQKRKNKLNNTGYSKIMNVLKTIDKLIKNSSLDKIERQRAHIRFIKIQLGATLY